jgi:hypothetical protein
MVQMTKENKTFMFESRQRLTKAIRQRVFNAYENTSEDNLYFVTNDCLMVREELETFEGKFTLECFNGTFVIIVYSGSVEFGLERFAIEKLSIEVTAF